jgi:hypothetical protein
VTGLRSPAGASSGRAPLLCERGGCSITRGTGQGAAELRPDAGLGPDIWALVISPFLIKCWPAGSIAPQFPCRNRRMDTGRVNMSRLPC